MNTDLLISIKTELEKLNDHPSLWVQCMSAGATSGELLTAIKEINAQTKDNRPLVVSQLGEPLVSLIEEFDFTY